MYTNVAKDSKLRMSLSSDNLILIQILEIIKMLDNKDIYSKVKITIDYTERQLRKVRQLIEEEGALSSVKKWHVKTTNLFKNSWGLNKTSMKTINNLRVQLRKGMQEI